MKFIKHILITTFGTGLLPGPKGTYGALPALLLFWFWRSAPWWVPVAGFALFSIITVWAAPYAIARWPRLKPGRGEVDPGQCNADELAGQFLTYSFIPLVPSVLLVGFLLFRFFDVLKPFPADKAQHMPAGWGILMDDLIVAIYANLIMWVLIMTNWMAWLEAQLIAIGVSGFLAG